MSLYLDGSFTDRYRDAVALGPEDMLFLRVDLQTNHSFALVLAFSHLSLASSMAVSMRLRHSSV